MKTLGLSKMNSFSEGYICSNFRNQVTKLVLVPLQWIHCFIVIFLILSYNTLCQKAEVASDHIILTDIPLPKAPQLAAYCSAMHRVISIKQGTQQAFNAMAYKLTTHVSHVKKQEQEQLDYGDWYQTKENKQGGGYFQKKVALV